MLRNWDQIKASEPGRERGIFGEVPENLPALLYARKLQRRACLPSVWHAGRSPDACEPGRGRSGILSRTIGERLFALVDEARISAVDPELALRAAAQRFREKIVLPETEEP